MKAEIVFFENGQQVEPENAIRKARYLARIDHPNPQTYLCLPHLQEAQKFYGCRQAVALNQNDQTPCEFCESEAADPDSHLTNALGQHYAEHGR